MFDNADARRDEGIKGEILRSPTQLSQTECNNGNGNSHSRAFMAENPDVPDAMLGERETVRGKGEAGKGVAFYGSAERRLSV